MLKRFKINGKSAKFDAISATTVSLVNIPEGMAYALAAGVNPVYGLYAGIVPPIVAAVTAGSVLMVVTLTNEMALMTFGMLDELGIAMPVAEDTMGLVFMFTIMIGVWQLFFGFLKLGNLLRFVSQSVMTGFITGTALLIILGQIDEFTGCVSGVEHNKVLAAIDILLHPGCWDIPTLITGLSMIAMVLLFNKTPLRRIGLITALVMTGVIVYALSWASVELVGDIAEIPRSFPVPMLPDFGAIDDVIIPALATAILGVAVAAGVSQNYPNPDGSVGKANKDFVGIGAANAVGGFFQSVPTTGSLSRTAVAVNAGAKSRMSNIFAGLIMVGVMFTIAPAAELIPMAGLAGLLIYVGYEAINQQKLRHAWHTSWPARIAMITTCALCLIIELQYALFAGIFLSLILFLYHQSINVRVRQLVPLGGGRFEERKTPDRYPDNQVTALNFEGTSFFAAIQTIELGLPSAEGVKNAAVILVGRGKDIPNNTFLTWLERYARDLQKSGNLLMLAEIQPGAKEAMINTGTVAAIGEENIFIAKGAVFASLEEAVAAAEKWIAKNKTM